MAKFYKILHFKTGKKVETNFGWESFIAETSEK